MPCFHPRSGWRSKTLNPDTGKRPIVYNLSQGFKDLPVTHACGSCAGCRLARARNWTTRVVHEAQLYERNTVVTLTYRDECLPPSGSLWYPDFQEFMHRLRKHQVREHRRLARPRPKLRRLRFYMCGEYGERRQRPHYHAIIFGFDFSDKVRSRKSKRGEDYFTSESLDRLWGKGRTEIGTVNDKTAAYIARYVLKKQSGSLSQNARYVGEHESDPESLIRPVFRASEFTHMSLKGGIGKGWFDKFSSDLYPSDEVIINEFRQPVPRYYDDLYQESFPVIMHYVKADRRLAAKKELEKNPDQRLAVKERFLELKLKQLSRDYENDP